MERKLVVIVGTFVVVGVTLSAVIMVNDHQDSEVKNILFREGSKKNNGLIH